jgi:hypothetical protein
VRFAALLAAIAAFAFLAERAGHHELATESAQAHLVQVAGKPTRSLLENRAARQRENLAHARYVCRHGARANQRWHCAAKVWIKREWNETMNLLRPATVSVPAQPRGMSAAWAWYRTGATQCVVNHEGGWTSPSIDPPGMYAGRFQMDASFERETTFGAAMQERYGRAWSWPPWAQVYHAYEVWLYAGWSRWPTYARYCA